MERQKPPAQIYQPNCGGAQSPSPSVEDGEEESVASMLYQQLRVQKAGPEEPVWFLAGGWATGQWERPMLIEAYLYLIFAGCH